MSVTLEQIVAFVRRDGPQDAPFVFLTIEDGTDFKDKHDFEDYYGSPAKYEVWEPRERPKGMKDGKPGVFIPKIMCALRTGDITGWRSYRETALYVSENCNIKFNPIARTSTASWQSFMSESDGFTREEYERRCRAPERRRAILEKNPRVFVPSKLFIIMGTRDDWKPLLDEGVFKGETIRLLDAPAIGPSGHPRYEFFGNAAGTLRYCCFNIFRPGVSNADVIAFARRLRALAGSEMLQRLAMA